jgi:hypothetical protein
LILSASHADYLANPGDSQLQRIGSLYLKNNVIIGEIERSRCAQCGGGQFMLDIPEGGEKTTKELVQ